MTGTATSFRLARMSPPILATTLVALAVPIVLLTVAWKWSPFLMEPALLVVGLYLWVWLRFRPTRFIVAPDVLEIIWPAKRLRMRRDGITGVRLLGAADLRREVGFGMRVGAGGLWGGFGWLWTARRGIVQMYVSRTDGFVWIERGHERPWLITPDEPDAFVRTLGLKVAPRRSPRR